MERKNVKVNGIVAVMVLLLLLTGCGGSSKYEAATESEMAYDTAGGTGYASNDIYVTQSAAVEAPAAAAEEAYPEEEYAEDGGADSVEVKNTERKLIKNVDLNVETETFDELLNTINTKTESLGGYIESSYTYNGSSYYGGDRRNANMTIRIPADKLDDFLTTVSDVSNVISRNDNITDVTLQYVDLTSHKEMLQTEQDRLLELLEEAETIEDIIALEGRLSEVRYQIESMESQLRTYDNQVDYSTVYLNIDEVARFTPVKEQSIGEKIVTGFAESLYDVGEGLLDFGIGFIINIPYLVVWAVVIFVILLIIRLFIKRHCRKKMKKQMQAGSMQNENASSGQIMQNPDAGGMQTGQAQKADMPQQTAWEDTAGNQKSEDK